MDKSKINDCYLIIDAILRIQKLKLNKNYTQFVNLKSTVLNELMGDKRRLSALHLLEHGLGIIEVNSRYKFGTEGGVTNHTKSYLISKPYLGNIITIEGAEGGVCYNDALHTIDGAEGGVYNKADNSTHTRTHSTPPFLLHQQITCDWAKENTLTGRVFSSVNQMPKEQRNEEFKHLIEFDFKSSHIQHLIRLVMQQHDNLQLKLEGQVLLHEFLDTPDLYEYWAKDFNPECSRDRMKDNVMYWLTGSFTNRKGVQYLQRRFPLLTKYIMYNYINNSSGVKTLYGRRLPKRNGMVIKLMKSESYLINNILLNELLLLSQHHPIECYTVFDAMLIDQDNSNNLMNVLNEQGKTYLGFQPKVKINRPLIENLNKFKNKFEMSDNLQPVLT